MTPKRWFLIAVLSAFTLTCLYVPQRNPYWQWGATHYGWVWEDLYRIDFERLVLEWLALAALAAVVLVVLHALDSKKEQGTK